ncbi:SphA family protein [Cupriavidus sp. D39]|uniref:SphA family protein n=1 Tax=Cupriavidus sp. D39 TaxID=2997877 RepID=UPI00226FF31D|nr:transporter [Cupriavidus sp. D39]MCY0853610.1 transporter [Cupriavidus sp. D39]
MIKNIKINNIIILETEMNWTTVVKSLALCGCLAIPGVALSTENGQQHYPIGLDTVLNGIVPALGETQYYQYTVFYSASKFAGSSGQSAVPNFQANTFATAPRVLHTWGKTLGPFTVTSGFALTIVHPQTRLPSGSDNRWGLSSLTVHAANIGYSNPEKTFFGLLALDFQLPIGSYDPKRMVNTSSNTYAFLPGFKFTLFPIPGAEVSGTFIYEISSRNNATGYHSGDVAVVDWMVGYSVFPNLQLGVQGYMLQQVTDDSKNGTALPGDGFRGRAYAIGPQVRFNFTKRSGIVLKWQHEFEVHNRPKGDRIWLEFTLPLDL